MIVMRKTFTAQAGRIARRGFTLVEILATVLILSILAGLVLVGGRAAMRFFRGVNDKATIDNIAKAALIQFWTCIVARQNTFQFGVLALNGLQSIIYHTTYFGGMSCQ